jgi:hypothetical protein
MPKSEKSKEDRLSETMNLLRQLQENGVKKNSLSFLDLQKKMGEWVQTGGSADYVVSFPEYGREAIVSLPRYDNKAATINFKVK